MWLGVMYRSVFSHLHTKNLAVGVLVATLFTLYMMDKEVTYSDNGYMNDQFAFNNDDDVIESEDSYDQPRALLIVEERYRYAQPLRQVTASLEFLRVTRQVRLSRSYFDDLTEKRLHDVIILLNLESYSAMEAKDKTTLKKYCSRFKIGVLILHWYSHREERRNDLMPLARYPVINITSYRINTGTSLWRTTKDGGTIRDNVENGQFKWMAFDIRGQPKSSYEPLALVKTARSEQREHIVGILDTGQFDGIRKIVLGNTLSFWLHHSILLDALHDLTGGVISLPLQRTVIIDIDDMFLGASGNKMDQDDVQFLLDFQRKMKTHILNFKFNLAFSGNRYKKGSQAEIEGDVLLTEHKDEFDWFPHTFSHVTAQRIPALSLLEKQMEENKQFAENLKLPIIPHYSVSPAHSGIYPVIEPLYTSWKRVWDIKVTASTTYNKALDFNRLHKGFVHSGIQVLPRDSLEIYSTHYFWQDVPGGKATVDRNIRGGPIYLRFLYNTLMMVMTHSYNFKHDRLACYAIEHTFLFLRKWTNLKFVTKYPMTAAKEYFDRYPDEKSIIWQNPCRPSIAVLYVDESKCGVYRYSRPDFLLLGPPMSGIDVLQMYLTMHPNIKTKSPVSGIQTDGEVEFFNWDENYQKGVEWYMDQFVNLKSPEELLFEKSIHYLSHSETPGRMFGILPRAKLIIVLSDPVIRARMVYQKMRSRKFQAALSHSFYDVISARDDADRAVLQLRRNCLEPGLYAVQLERFLQFYPRRQVKIIDTEQLITYPLTVLKSVCRFLGTVYVQDQSMTIRYDENKDFVCLISEDPASKVCVRGGRGNDLPEMTVAERRYLYSYFRTPNMNLYHLLSRENMPVPGWLETFIRSTN